MPPPRMRGDGRKAKDPKKTFFRLLGYMKRYWPNLLGVLVCIVVAAIASTRGSENIGKLYMVSQANAKTIMANAEENSKIANMEIEKNVSAIEETHKALESLKQSINETSQNFTKEVESLMHSLEEAKEKFSSDNVKNGEVSDEFTALLEVVSK